MCPCFLIGELRDHDVFSGSEAAATPSCLDREGGVLLYWKYLEFVLAAREVCFLRDTGKGEKYMSRRCRKGAVWWTEAEQLAVRGQEFRICVCRSAKRQSVTDHNLTLITCLMPRRLVHLTTALLILLTFQ